MRKVRQKRHIPPITNGNLKLRLLESEDLDRTLGWRNQDNIRRWFIHSNLIMWEQHQKWFKQYLLRDNDFIFIIEENRKLRKPIGQISLYEIDWKRKHGEFGRLMIGEADARNRGFAKEATRMILSFGFAFLELSSIELEVFSRNIPAIAIYRKMGFQVISENNGLKKMVLHSDWIPSAREHPMHDFHQGNAPVEEVPSEGKCASKVV